MLGASEQVYRDAPMSVRVPGASRSVTGLGENG